MIYKPNRRRKQIRHNFFDRKMADLKHNMLNIIMPKVPNNQDFVLQKFSEYLPEKPYCADDLKHGLKVRPKSQAEKCCYIQYNPITKAHWLVFDIDTDEISANDLWSKGLKNIPTPNMSVENQHNFRRHEFYLIDPAVYKLQQAREKPLKLAASVDRGLTILLNADPSYSKLIAKNPLSDHFEVTVWHEKEYGLLELLEYIPKNILKTRIKPKDEVGLGRNCTIFDKSRQFAYQTWRKQGFSDDNSLFNKVYQFSMNLNSEFLAPLGGTEVKSITKSICRWTAKNMSAGEFSGIQKKRNAKSIAVRSAKSEARADEARALYASGKTQAQIALMMGISQQQVSRLLSKM
jgi:hypothetical protein